MSNEDEQRNPIPDSDVEITFFRSSGPGGQKKNVTDSAVRVRHLPTGIIVVAQRERSQLRNKESALQELARRLEARRRKPKYRIPSRPTLGAKRARVDEKHHRGAIKKLRKKPSGDD